MAKSNVVVTYGVKDADAVPDCAAGFAAVVEGLQKAHFFRELSERLRVQRSGYAAVDVFLFVLLFFLAGLPGGLSGVCAAIKGKLTFAGSGRNGRRIPEKNGRFLTSGGECWVTSLHAMERGDGGCTAR